MYRCPLRATEFIAVPVWNLAIDAVPGAIEFYFQILFHHDRAVGVDINVGVKRCYREILRLHRRSCCRDDCYYH